MNRNERLIVRTLIATAITAGWQLTQLDDGDEHVNVSSADKAIELGCNLDECQLHFEKAGGEVEAWVKLIFCNGNDGLDVISDYHTCLDFMTEVEEYIKQLEVEYQGKGLYVAGAFAPVNAKDKVEQAAPVLLAALKAALAALAKVPAVHQGGSQALDNLVGAAQTAGEVAVLQATV